MYSCPVTPGGCEGVRGNTSRYLTDQASADNNASFANTQARTLPQEYVEGRLFDQARRLILYVTMHVMLSMLSCTYMHVYICSTRIPNLSGYVSGCPLRNGVPRCVTGCPDAQLQIHDNRLHNGAVPLRNRASSRLSRYATGQDRGCPVAQPGNMNSSCYVTGQGRGCPVAQPGNMKSSCCATGQERGCMWLSRYATGQHKAAPLSNRTRSKPSCCATGQ